MEDSPLDEITKLNKFKQRTEGVESNRNPDNCPLQTLAKQAETLRIIIKCMDVVWHYFGRLLAVRWYLGTVMLTFVQQQPLY